MPPAPLTRAPIDVAAVLRAVESPARGAALLFLGTVRAVHQGRKVLGLAYEAYEPMAEEALADLVRRTELEAGEGSAAAIVHRLGELGLGEVSVAIAVATPHRDAAYRASRFAIEALKRDVPIFKKEHFEGGEVWIEGPGEASPVPPAHDAGADAPFDARR